MSNSTQVSVNTSDNSLINKENYKDAIRSFAKRQHGFVANQDVASLLCLTPDQAYKEIKKIENENLLYKYQGGKYTKYKLK